MNVPRNYWERWAEKAEHDFVNAEYTLTLPDDRCPYDTVVFHAQQCAEKYLKALLVFHQVEVSKTHDLRRLAALLEVGGVLPEGLVMGDLDLLNAYAVEVRYSDDAPEIEAGEARDAIRAAAAVRAVVQGAMV